MVQRLASLNQEEVDGYIEKVFGRPEQAPLRSILRGLLRVDPALRGTLDQARKKGAFALDTSLMGAFQLF